MRTLCASVSGIVLAACASDPVATTELRLVVEAPLPAVANSGVPFAQQPVIRLVDDAGQQVMRASLPITVTIASGGGNLVGTSTVTTNDNGVAAFTDIALVGTVGNRVLAFSGPADVAGVSSTTIRLDPGPPALLRLTVTPSELAHSGTPFTLQPVVQLIDGGGNVAAFQGKPVSAYVSAGSATVSGVTTVETDANGRATFADLALAGTTGTVVLGFQADLQGITARTTAELTLSVHWMSRVSMPTARVGHAIAELNGVLYSIGGVSNLDQDVATTEAYDPALERWTTRASMPSLRGAFAAGAVSGLVYATGGFNQAGTTLATVEAYDPAANSWSPRAAMPTPRHSHGTAVVGGTMFVIGGTAGGVAVASVDAYDPATNTWSPRAPMPTARANPQVGVVNGVLYAVGGFTTGGTALSVVEAYDPVTNSWSSRAPMPTARFGFAVGVVGTSLYALGGIRSTGGLLATVEVFNAATNTWAAHESMPTVRAGPAIGVVNGILFAIGGVANSGNVIGVVEAFIPQ